MHCRLRYFIDWFSGCLCLSLGVVFNLLVVCCFVFCLLSFDVLLNFVFLGIGLLTD